MHPQIRKRGSLRFISTQSGVKRGPRHTTSPSINLYLSNSLSILVMASLNSPHVLLPPLPPPSHSRRGVLSEDMHWLCSSSVMYAVAEFMCPCSTRQRRGQAAGARTAQRPGSLGLYEGSQLVVHPARMRVDACHPSRYKVQVLPSL